MNTHARSGFFTRRSGLGRRLGSTLAALLMIGAGVGVILPETAVAQVAPGTIVVDTTADGGGDCGVAGSCTLRAALDDAATSPGSIIVVPAGVYVLTGGELDVPASTTVQGAAGQGAAATVIDAQGSSRVFDVTTGGVTISGVTITGGDVNQTGGGIRVGSGGDLALIDSRVTANTAREGGGVDNQGTLVVSGSTIDANSASRKGGGIRNNGIGTIENTTIVSNTADQGGGLSSPGSTVVTHATIVRNVATSSSSAGVARNGGSLTIAYSIIADNFRSGGAEASDCSGTPDLVELNLVSDLQGCNPVGTTLVDAAPGIGALADNGGPTPTVELLETNAVGDPNVAVDAVVPGDCVLSVDQRGTARPTGTGCELGAFEIAPLSLEFSLDVDTSAYTDDPSTPEPEVEVGVVTIPTELILEELITRTEDESTAGPAAAALRSIALRSIPLRSIALRSIDPQSAALRSIALRSIPLRSIALRSIALRSIVIDSTALRSIALRSILLTDVPLETEDGWEAHLVGTQFEGLPLQSITVEDLVGPGGPGLPDTVTLEDISIEASALRSIALRSIVLADVALRSIELPDGNGDPITDPVALEAAWCSLLGELCGNGSGQIVSADLMDLDLLSVQLAGGDVEAVPLFDIPVASALRSIVIEDTALRSIALRSIAIQQSALRSIALRSIALRSIADGVDHIGSLVDCGLEPAMCSTDATNDALLGDVPDAALIGTIGDLGDLPADLLDGISIGDLLLAFVPSDSPSWESIDLDGALLQNLPDLADRQPTFDYVATVVVTGGPGDLDINVTLPTGFAFARGAGDPAATFDGAPVLPVDSDLGQAQFLIDGVPNGVHQLVLPARAGLTTGGPFVAVGQVVGTSGAETATPPPDMAAVNVVEAFEADGAGSPVPVLLEGELQLAHISRADDVDLYALTVPQSADGATASVRLSNVPDGVDYDLSIYAPERQSLRGEPTISLESLGDIGFDLDPSDDIYETDVVGDIPRNVPGDRGIDGFALRDISTRRSNADEQVETGVLDGGATYYIAVSSYLDDFSDQPYGLRVRLNDGIELPTCAGPRALPTVSAATQVAMPAGVNTLYITNTQWLDAQLAGSPVTVQQILDAIAATSGIAGVVPGVVTVDSDATVRNAHANWAANRCDVDARNAVVSAIGDVLDGIVAANPTVENIVIVGGDGVVPQAAVPDLTEFSNENTFALEAVGNGQNNEVAAALGAGTLLTDDPYATTAGIDVRNGDHELFVPTLVTGRLVETGDQILGQLQNFVAYDGRLDPGTLPGSDSLVTGYDFLADGADAIAAQLASLGALESLISETWDRADLLAALESSTAALISVNAHYDFESLLPAAADGTLFDQGDLVTTADVLDTGFDRLPDHAALFTAGCHAGLSMDDVQLGFGTDDWAQTFANNTNVFAAHTTYGFGDTELVAYSERLLELFSSGVAGIVNGDPGAPASLGAAMRDAKQNYLAETLVLTPYDEKILQSMTFYGMPMFVVGDAVGAPAPPSPLAAHTGGSPVSFESPDGSGVSSVGVDLTPTVGSSAVDHLNLVSTDAGDYYEVGGNTIRAQYRAVQPLVKAPIPAANGPAAGFLITELTTIELSSWDPYYLQPTLDAAANEGYIDPADGSFPASLHRIATLPNGDQQLLVAGGQFQDGLDSGLDVQRIFPSLEGDLYPVNGAPSADPIFTRVVGRVGESETVVQFEMETDRAVQRVYVLFKEQDQLGTVAWRGLDLFNVNGSNTWLGAAPVSAPGVTVEFFVQMVALDNTVHVSDNKVDNFLATLPNEAGELEIQLSGADLVNGYHTGPVTATVLGSTSPETLETSVDSGPFVDGDSVVVSGEGGHVVFAQDGDGGREFVFFVIDSIGPDLAADASPAGAVVSGDVTVTASASDIGQSGVASITYSATGAQPIAATTVDADTAIFDITADGTTVVTLFATDNAGNESAPVDLTITIDKTSPTVSAEVVDPQPAAAWYGGDVTIRVTGDDGGGVGIGQLIVDGVITDVTPATATASTDVVVFAEGTNTVEFSAVDAAGNASATGSIDVSIDLTAPDTTLVIDTVDDNGNGIWEAGEAATATFACSDALSGVSTCELAVDGTVVATSAGTVALDTSSPGDLVVVATGIDEVGNQSSTSETLGVPTMLCLDYDPSQAKQIGSNYTIRVYLCDGDGNNLSSRQITLTAISVDGTIDPGPNDSGNANRQFEARYSNGSKRYTYNLDTSGFDIALVGPGLHYLWFEVTGDGATTYVVAAPFTLAP